MTNKKTVKQKTEKLIEMTSGFCEKHLDEEYRDLCIRLIRKMSRKRTVPFMTGRMDIWAAGIVNALGNINFVFHSESDPHICADDICNYFCVKKATVGNKSRKIRELMKLREFDKEFSIKDLESRAPGRKQFERGMKKIAGLIKQIAKNKWQ